MTPSQTIALDSFSVAPSRRSGPRLSVLVLSGASPADFGQSVSTLVDELRALDAQLVVVCEDRRAELESLGSSVTQGAIKVVETAAGSCRSTAVDAGMAAVDGDIVIVRDALQVRRMGWLKPVARMVGPSSGAPSQSRALGRATG